jgi:hypothetical protein
MNLLKKLGMLAGAAGPIIVKFVPGPIGTAVGLILTGIGLAAGYNHPTPAAQKAFGDSAK